MVPGSRAGPGRDAGEGASAGVAGERRGQRVGTWRHLVVVMETAAAGAAAPGIWDHSLPGLWGLRRPHCSLPSTPRHHSAVPRAFYTNTQARPAPSVCGARGERASRGPRATPCGCGRQSLICEHPSSRRVRWGHASLRPFLQGRGVDRVPPAPGRFLRLPWRDPCSYPRSLCGSLFKGPCMPVLASSWPGSTPSPHPQDLEVQLDRAKPAGAGRAREGARIEPAGADREGC